MHPIPGKSDKSSERFSFHFRKRLEISSSRKPRAQPMIEGGIAKKISGGKEPEFMAGFGSIGPLITRNLPNERSVEK